MAANGISSLSTKEEKQKAKLDLAANNRAADSNPRASYDISQLPTQYVGNDVYDNPNAGGLVTGRPWIATVAAFTFYEAFGSGAGSTISTTQYVSGNKIYASSSTFDSVPVVNSQVIVNDVVLLDNGSVGDPRGQTLVVLNSYGDLVSSTRFDTWDGVTGPANLTALAAALTAVASGNIAVLVSYDATAFNSACRTALTNAYGDTNSNTWTSSRTSQIFIGVRI